MGHGAGVGGRRKQRPVDAHGVALQLVSVVDEGQLAARPDCSAPRRIEGPHRQELPDNKGRGNGAGAEWRRPMNWWMFPRFNGSTRLCGVVVPDTSLNYMLFEVTGRTRPRRRSAGPRRVIGRVPRHFPDI